ncbi:hypothetical protein FKW77_007158 [Venturia effusa]|uniref:BTB domain-containing protein n=1 Tax=Venturia effusa TaxID=50376 RepID=A0A517LCJ2_9PEZI|nr:hypothetical protein FKW77_007158 [Venturia effusa]
MDQPKNDIAVTALRKGVSNVFESGEYSDLTVRCQNKDFNVHKVVVCAQSDWFKNACKTTFQEGQSGLITLPDEEYNAIQGLLQHMYEFRYNGPGAEDASALAYHLDLYTVADKYQCAGLRQLAIERFSAAAHHNWNSPELVEAIKTIYKTPAVVNHKLRESALDVVLNHLKKLVSSADRRNYPRTSENDDTFTALLETEGEFSKDVIQAMLTHDDDSERRKWPSLINYGMAEIKCLDCNTTWRISNRSEHFRPIEARCPYIPDLYSDDDDQGVVSHTGNNVKVSVDLEDVDPNDFSLHYCESCRHTHYLLGDPGSLVDGYNLYCVACGSFLLPESEEQRAVRLSGWFV